MTTTDEKKITEKSKTKKSPVMTIILVVLLLIVVGVIVFFVLKKDVKDGDGMERRDGDLARSADTDEVAQLFAQKKALNCKITDKAKGTSYQIMANDGFTKMKMISQVSAGTEYMLFIDGDLYLWTDYSDTAIKMKAATTTAQLVTDLEKQMTPEQAMEEKSAKGEPMIAAECGSAENMDFTPPAEITFNDLGSVGGNEGGTGEATEGAVK